MYHEDLISMTLYLCIFILNAYSCGYTCMFASVYKFASANANTFRKTIICYESIN